MAEATRQWHGWRKGGAVRGRPARVRRPHILATRVLFAVRLIIPADLADEGADALADVRAPCPELVVGCRRRWWLGVEDVLCVLLEQRIDGAAGAEAFH
jgi:hypothetical protein